MRPMRPMSMLSAAQQDDEDSGDAFAVLKVHTARGSGVALKISNVKRLVQLLSAVGGGRDSDGKYFPLASDDSSSTSQRSSGPWSWPPASEGKSTGNKAPAWLPAAWTANAKPARALQPGPQQSAKAVSCKHEPLQQLLLCDIPPAAACLIYQRLGKSARRALMLSSKELRALFSCAVRVLHLCSSDLKHCGVEQLSRLPSLFPGLNEFHLQLGTDTDLLLALRQLTRSSGSSRVDSSSSSSRQQLRHLRAFSLDSRLRGDAFQALAKFLVLQQGLAKLLLPHQRCSSPNDQRVLAGVLEALPGLTHLDLGFCPTASGGNGGSSSRPGRVSDSSTSSSGGCGSRAGRISDSSTSSSNGGSPRFAASSSAAAAAAACQVAASNAICSSVFRRIVQLQGLRGLSFNAGSIPDMQLEALSTLRGLQDLRVSATGSGQGLAAALKGLTRLSNLELQHPNVCGELQGCLAGLQELQVLALGLCPKLTDAMMPEVAQLWQLEKLTLPFPLTAPHLRLLSHLPHLEELYSWRQIELDVLGPAHEPLLRITRLVAGSINGRGKSLAAWFPNVEVLCLKHCSDLAALSLRGCVSLQELLAGECGQLSNEGFACLRGLKALQRLQMEGASQLTDAAFSAVFSGTMPALQQVSIAGCPGISDAALQLLTASCRRLSTISISSCRQLTDKTLKRLAHCERLSSVVLKGCRGFTAEGVAALAAAPQMKQVCVNGCMGVRSSLCKGYRPGVKVRVEDRL